MAVLFEEHILPRTVPGTMLGAIGYMGEQTSSNPCFPRDQVTKSRLLERTAQLDREHRRKLVRLEQPQLTMAEAMAGSLLYE